MYETPTDLEDFLNKIKSNLVSNLNAKIDSINTAKGDTLLWKIASTDHFFFLRNLPNKGVFTNIYIEKIGTKQNNSDSGYDIEAAIEIAFRDDLTENGMIRGLRYNKALKLALETQAEELGYEITEFLPTNIGDKGIDLIVAGVKIKYQFA